MNEWISVEDYLPNYDESVLISNSEGVEIAVLLQVEPDGVDCMGSNEGFLGVGGFALPGRSFGEELYRHDAQGQPTHWMNLPEPPRGIAD